MSDWQPGECSGQCCDAFALGGDLEFLKSKKNPGRDDPEIDQILGMIVYLGAFGRNPGHPVCGEEGRALEPTEEARGHFYTCTNLENGRCGIYETRPKMCRSYPNEERCPFRSCTMVMPISVLLTEAWKEHSGRGVYSLPEWSQKLAWGEVRYLRGELSQDETVDMSDIRAFLDHVTIK